MDSTAVLLCVIVQVIDVSKKFMGDTLATGYDDPRVTLVRALTFYLEID